MVEVWRCGTARARVGQCIVLALEYSVVGHPEVVGSRDPQIHEIWLLEPPPIQRAISQEERGRLSDLRCGVLYLVYEDNARPPDSIFRTVKRIVREVEYGNDTRDFADSMVTVNER